MNIFLPDLEVSPTEGFSPQKDIFGRAQLGKGLTNLVSSADDPLVIGVDGQWGSGKTIFLKMWAGELRKAGFPVIYFDAFAHDYADDAFLALAGEILGLAAELKEVDASAVSAFKKKAITVGKVLTRSALKIGVKVITAGILEADDFSSISESVSDVATEMTDKYLGEAITSAREEKSKIEEFKVSLSELPKLLQPSLAVGQEAKPLIFIVDELDRCKPTFSVNLLERLKHFFSVRNVHFVLGINRKELVHCVSALYGSTFDSDTYLQKFVRVHFPLVDIYAANNEQASDRFIDFPEKSHDLASKDPQYADQSFKELKRLNLHLNLSLRATSQVASYMALALNFVPPKFFKLAPLVVGLCILKVHSPNLFVNAKRGTLQYLQLAEVFGYGRSEGTFPISTPRTSEGLWRYLTESNPHQNIQEQFGQLFVTFSERHRILPFFANQIVDSFVMN